MSKEKKVVRDGVYTGRITECTDEVFKIANFLRDLPDVRKICFDPMRTGLRRPSGLVKITCDQNRITLKVTAGSCSQKIFIYPTSVDGIRETLEAMLRDKLGMTINEHA